MPRGPRIGVGTGALLLALALTGVGTVSAKPVSGTPGYPGLSRVPTTQAVSGGGSSRPGKPIHLGQGYRPHLLVDGAGTAHITYSLPAVEHGPAGEHTYTPGQDVYCRLVRGASGCASSASFVAPITYPVPDDTTPFFDNSPGLNQDPGEGSIPLASGDSLLILAHREGNVVAVPGGTSDNVNFLYSSDDGGKTFTGPGIISTNDYQSGAITYDADGITSIGTLGESSDHLDDPVASTFFQGGAAGAFTPDATEANLGPGQIGVNGGQLVLDGDRPVAVSDNFKDVTVREYTGSGDINDPANWTSSSFPGLDPSLAGGDHGVWLAYQPPGVTSRGVVVKIVNGRRSGPETKLFSPLLQSQDDELAEAGDGQLTAAWEPGDESGGFPRIVIATSNDGRHWSQPQQIYHVPTHNDSVAGLQIATGPDGGGVAVFVHGSTHSNTSAGVFGIGGQVVAVPFGPRGSTGKKGLGGLGAGTPGQAGCLDIRFGAVHAHVDAGCFLRVVDPRDPAGNASIAFGGVHVNGLELRPDSSHTGIVIDASTHTIDSVGGTVSILLQHPGVPDITLWDGSLHAFLGAHDNSGDLLFPLPMSGFHANVLGFDALGTVDVLLGHESVSIPMALKLPAYLGVTGAATLAASMSDDLDPSSLHITIPTMVFPGLEASHASLDWTGPQQQWAGTTELQMQPGAGAAGMDVTGAPIAFDHGDFTSGGFSTAPDPGTPIFHNAYLSGLDAAFDLHPPRSLTGNAELGAVAHGGGVYSLEATGPLRTAFGNPSTMTVAGDGAIYGVPLTSAQATFETDGVFHETGTLGFTGGGVTVGGTADASTDLATATTSGTLTGGFSFGSYSVGQTIPFNDVGFGYCKTVGIGPASVSAGFLVKWSGGAELHLDGCDSALSGSGAASARIADDGVTVTPGTAVEELDVRATAGVPDVVLTSPGGQTVVPSMTNAHAAAIALAVPGVDLEAVAIPHPAAGAWRVSAQTGSAPITAVAGGRGYAPPTVFARVLGSGPRRVLRYSFTAHPGLTVRFAEYHGSTLLGVLGVSRSAHGRLRFAPADGPAGPRRIVALIGGASAIPQSVTVARYRAPGPSLPGRARLRLAHRGRLFVVHISPDPGAARYRVSARTTGGRRVEALVGARSRTLTVPASGWSDRISVTVTPLSTSGHAGHVTRASLGIRVAAPRYRAARRRR